MIPTFIEQQQETILFEAKKNNHVLHDPCPQILRDIQDCEEQVAEIALGELGQRLKAFAQNVDLDHPCLPSGLFDSDHLKDYSNRFSEFLKLAKYAKESGMQECIPLLSKAATAKLPRIFRLIDDPRKNHQFVRGLKAKEDRNDARSCKRMRNIDLTHLYKNATETWSTIPTDFEMYSRFSKSYTEEIYKANLKVGQYLNLGCVEMGKKIEESIEDFRSRLEDNHYGFHLISISMASGILAKLHGFKYAEITNKITIPRNFFAGYIFDPRKKNQPQSTFCNHGYYKTIDVAAEERVAYRFGPRAYPLQEMSEIPERVSNLVDFLESFPEANGKAIFDHYIVIMPSVDYPGKSNDDGTYSMLDGDKQLKEFEKVENLHKELDSILINKKIILPALLASRNGKCYFICYWM